MSDQIPFRVVPQTPQDIPNTPDMAVLSTDEYVFPVKCEACFVVYFCVIS